MKSVFCILFLVIANQVYGDVESLPDKVPRSVLDSIQVPKGHALNCIPVAPAGHISSFEDSACNKIVHCKMNLACYIWPDNTEPEIAKKIMERPDELEVVSFKTTAICRAMAGGEYCPDATRCALDSSVKFKDAGFDTNIRWYRPDGTYVPSGGSK